MARTIKSERAKAEIVAFAKREIVPMDLALKAFLDDCVIPILIREALGEMKTEKSLELALPSVTDCQPNRGNAEAGGDR